MKMRFIFLLSGLFLLSVFAFGQIPESANHLLTDFDFKAAKKTMDQKHIPGSDRKGYLEYLMRQHIAAKDPAFFTNKSGNTIHIKKDPNGNLTFASTCNNIGFDNESFSSWAGGTGTVPSTVWTGGIKSNGLNAGIYDPNARHTIMTTPAADNTPPTVIGYDSIAINPNTNLADIPLVAPGGGFVSARLGNANVGFETERLRYTFSVTASNAQLTYQYAVVLQDPQHSPGDQPFFSFKIFNTSNVQIGGNCGKYFVDATLAATDTTFKKITYQSENLYYKPWTTVTVDLTSFVGQTITVEFQTADCTLGGHFGYAYIDLTCAALQGSVGFCPNDPYALLTAPSGFVSYQWYDPSNNPIPASQGGTNDSLKISNPTVGSIYTATMVSVTGCVTSLQVTINYSNITTTMQQSATCVTGTSGSATVLASGSSSGYTYSWNTVPVQTTQTITGLGAGTYIVKVSGNNCLPTYDTVTIGTKTIAPTSSLAYFCPGSNAWAIAPAVYSQAPSHTWYLSGAVKGTNDTLIITAPVRGQVYTDSIIDKYGCELTHRTTLDTTTIKLNYQIGSDSICAGQANGYAYAYVTANGGVTYTWSSAPPNTPKTGTGTFAYIWGLSAGTYTVTFSVSGGCATTASFNIKEMALDDSTVIVNYKCGDPSAKLVAPECTYYDSLWGYGCYYFWLNSNGDTLQQNAMIYDSIWNYSYYIPYEGDSLTISPVPAPGTSICLWLLDYNQSYCPRRICYTFNLTGGGNKTLDSLVNVFSPNGDNTNDKFYPFYSANVKYPYDDFYIEQYNIKIFNRWGLLVYESNDFKEGWDGKTNGNDCGAGVYYWMASYTTRCDDAKTENIRKGPVQLVR